MGMRRSAVLGVVVAVAATVGVLAPSAVATGAGCTWATDPADAAAPALDVQSARVDTVLHGASPWLDVTLSVRSLQASAVANIPVDAQAVQWRASFKNNANRWPGAVQNPYLRVTLDRVTGTPVAEMGYVVGGQPVPYVGGNAVLIPGTPGSIVLSQDLSTLSVATDNTLTDFTASTSAIGLSGPATVDSVGLSRTAYRVATDRHDCIDPAQPAQPLAIAADRFGDSVGVNIHLNYAGYMDYGRTDSYVKVEQALADLRVRHVREIWSGNPDVIAEVQRLRSQGVKTDMVFGTATELKPTLAQALDYLRAMPDVFSMIEGHNEPADAPAAVAFQKELYPAVKNDPLLASIPVASPAVNQSSPATYQALGDLSAYADVGNIHDYAMAEPYSKTQVLDVFADLQRLVTGSKPMIVTETGWNGFLAGQYAGAAPGAPPVTSCNTCASEHAVASYVPKALLTNIAGGIGRTYLYELLDEGVFGPLGASDYFGLVRTDFAPKPAYLSLRNLMTILADPGPAFTAGSLGHTVADPDVRHVLLQKRDGSFWLALWQDARLFTPEPAGGERVGPGDLAPSSVTSTVTFDRGVAADTYRVAQSSSPVASAPTATVHSVVVPADDVVVLRLT
jgi:hypothetical protein